MQKTAITLLTLLIAAVPRNGCIKKEAKDMGQSQEQQTTAKEPNRPELAKTENPPQSGKYEKATFAAGCFWGVEASFRAIDGVVGTRVGYTGGQRENPTYRQVCTGKTGHAEAVQVTYDPKKVSFEDLLDVFWKIHDPTTPNRQGPDVGTQYRSAIFYHTPQQQTLAQASIQKLEKAARFKRSIVTQIAPAAEFYKAEEYHQRYLEKQGKTSCSSTIH